VNGKKWVVGIGKKSFSVNAPAAGQQTTVGGHHKNADGDYQHNDDNQNRR